jgi:hypothetical protein
VKNSSKKVGDALEDLVALLYEHPDLKVRTRTKLPVWYEPERESEIDVLLEGEIAGFPLQIAIECKSYSGPVGIDKIRDFASKLDDLRIPRKHGIFVSPSGYQSGVLSFAQHHGIKVLELEGLTSDRLHVIVQEATQTYVYLLCRITRFTITSGIEDGNDAHLFWFGSDNGVTVGTVFDLVWHQWRTGKIPQTLGNYEFDLEVPKGWNWRSEANGVSNSAHFEVQVIGLVVAETGSAKRVVLRDASTKLIERANISTEFEEGIRQLPIDIVYDEEELTELLKKNPGIARINWERIALPRIQAKKIYWPPSQRTFDLLQETMKQGHRIAWNDWWTLGRRSNPIDAGSKAIESLSFTEIEGTDLGTMWEPIMPSHPAQLEGWPFPNKMKRGNDPLGPRKGSRGNRRRNKLPRRYRE